MLTLTEAAAYLRVSEKQLRALVERADVPGRSIGTEWRFFKPALQAWLSATPQKKGGILSHIGAIADDPNVEEMLGQIYDRRRSQ